MLHCSIFKICVVVLWMTPSYSVYYNLTSTTTSTVTISTKLMFLSNSASYVDNNNSDTTLLNHEFPNFVAKRYNAKVFHILGLPIEVKNNASYENQCEWYMDSVVEIHGRDKSYCFSNRWFTQNIANWTNLFEIYGYLDISSKSSLPRHILEIGSFEGQSATFFVKNIISQHNESELFVIDTFKGSGHEHHIYKDNILPYLFEIFCHNIYITGYNSQVKIIQGNSLLELPKLYNYIQYIQNLTNHHKNINQNTLTISSDNIIENEIDDEIDVQYFDIIYIDGSHKARDVLSDAINSFPMLKINGLMIFDDYLRISGANDPYNDAKKGVDAFLQFYGSKLDIVLTGYQLVIRKITSTLIIK